MDGGSGCKLLSSVGPSTFPSGPCNGPRFPGRPRAGPRRTASMLMRTQEPTTQDASARHRGRLPYMGSRPCSQRRRRFAGTLFHVGLHGRPYTCRHQTLRTGYHPGDAPITTTYRCTASSKQCEGTWGVSPRDPGGCPLKLDSWRAEAPSEPTAGSKGGAAGVGGVAAKATEANEGWSSQGSSHNRV